MQPEEIATALEGKRLDAAPPTRGHCQRCLQKNRKRWQLDVSDRDRTRLQDGEEVLVLAYRVGGEWTVLDEIHAEHTPPGFDDLADQRHDQVRARANIDREAGGYRLRNVTVDVHSPTGQGQDPAPVVARLERLDTYGWVVELEPRDPHPLWPSTTREWLAGLLDEHADGDRADREEAVADD